MAALAIKAALQVPVAPIRDKQMFLSSEAGSDSSMLTFHHVLGQASLGMEPGSFLPAAGVGKS